MARRMAFKRHHSFVVVRPIHPSSNDCLNPGTIVSRESGYRGSILRWWYRRQQIAVVGCPWGEQMLKKYDSVGLPQIPQEPPPQEGPEDDYQELEIVEGKKGWYTLLLDGEEIDKVHGKKNLDAWLKENGYDDAE